MWYEPADRKFKDVETLLDLIKFDFEKYDILNSEMHDDYVIYKTSAEEFLISTFYKKTNFEMSCKTNNRPSVYLITEGRISVTGNFTDPNVNYEFFKGDSFLIPAIVDKYKISIFPETTFFSVQIP
jgi:mannose-6-phosphate isomerase class I